MYFALYTDLNRDGKPDLVVATVTGNPLAVLINNGNGLFFAPVTYPALGTGVGLVVADLNNDGKLDVAFATKLQGFSVYLGNGDGTLQPRRDYSVGAISLMVSADMNADGKPDLVLLGNGIGVLFNKGDGTFFGRIDSSVGILGPPLVGDFTGDGKMDVAGATVNKIVVTPGNGNGTFQPQIITTESASTNFTASATTDFNFDGLLDLILLDDINGASVYLGKGDGTFQTPIRGISSIGGSQGVTAVDLNADGKMDVVLANMAVFGIHLGTAN